MFLTVRASSLDSNEYQVILHDADYRQLEASDLVRVLVDSPRPLLVTVSRTRSLVPPGTVLMSRGLISRSGLQEGEEVKLSLSPPPDSVRSIRRTMDGIRLEPHEIRSIVVDVMEGRLTKSEISAWLTAVQVKGLTVQEVQELAKAMMETGCSLSFQRGPVYDFHSVGGLPGNKVTPIVVSIVAAAGLMLPKTSSRAISSACGTADFVEVFCNVSLSGSRLKEISEKFGAVFAWGGAMNITPVSGHFIDVQYPLGIDPRSMMMASIMSKKMAMGADRLLMDIPTGPRTKVRDTEEALGYAREFIDLGNTLGIQVECAITDGSQPLGYAIGPALEARECIQTLEGDARMYMIREKSCELAGMILEMGGVSDGYQEAIRLLDTGEALRKFQDIVHAQEGRHDLCSEHISLGRFRWSIPSPRSGYILDIHNKQLVAVARAAGAPKDKGGGVLLHRRLYERVEKGETLMEIYADNKGKLERAKEVALKLRPMMVGGMVMGHARDIHAR